MKTLVVSSVFAVLLLASPLLVGVTSSLTGAHPYDPWYDVNDDGVIDVRDVYQVSLRYGTDGTPLVKASIRYDSGWMNITDNRGQCINVIHGLSSDDAIVDIIGKTTLEGGQHQRHLGSTGCTVGWNVTYGGTDWDEAYSLVETSDEGYALTGGTLSFGAGEYDFWLVKTDATGNIEWNKTYGGTSYDYAYSVVQTGDGGYALTGSTTSFGAGSDDFWLVKTDALGNHLWNKTYGGINSDYAYDLVETSDGGYALAGQTHSFGADDRDFWLVKTDAAGNQLWNKTYGGTNLDWAYGLVETGDGGYTLAGVTYSFGAGSGDFWLVKTDATGNMEWNKTYGGTEADYAWALVEASNGGYALAGYTSSFGAGNGDFWLVKTDAAGNALWNKTYGGNQLDEAYALVETSDGGYAMAGYTQSFGAGSGDFWLVKTDAGGSMEWNKTYGGTSDDLGLDLVETTDGGYAITGYTISSGNHDFWLVKTDIETGFAYGVGWIDSTVDSIVLYRGSTDPYWNYVRIRIWEVHNP